MSERIEKISRLVYRRWKEENTLSLAQHPEEEELACFLEDKLSLDESAKLKAHLLSCAHCSEIVATQIKLKRVPELDAPKELVASIQALVDERGRTAILEVILAFKEKVIELLSTTGDCLVGQEFIPAPVLRSRNIKDFKDEVTILKDFKDIRVEARIQNKGGRLFDLSILARRKDTQELLKDLRVTLFKEDTELESYLADAGKVTFEHVQLGKYKVELSSLDDKVASVLLEIKT